MKWPTQTNQAQHQLQNRQSKILKKKEHRVNFSLSQSFKVKSGRSLGYSVSLLDSRTTASSEVAKPYISVL